MNSTFLKVSIPIVVILTVAMWLTDPTPVRWIWQEQEAQTSTEVGGPEPVDDSSLFPPCSERIHPDSPCDESRRIPAKVTPKMRMGGFVACASRFNNRMAVGKDEKGNDLVLLVDRHAGNIQLWGGPVGISAELFRTIDLDGSFSEEEDVDDVRVFQKALDVANEICVAH